MTESVPGRALKLVSTLKERRVLITLAVLLAALAVFLVWNGRAAKAESYLTQDIVKGDVVDTINASGTVEAENSVPLVFKNSAVIKAIYVREGQRVKKGDLLAEQDDSDLRVQYQQQLANLKAAEAKLALARAGARQEEVRQAEENVNIAGITCAQAKSNYERYSALFSQGAVSKTDLEKAENDYRLAEAKYNQAREQLNALKAGNRPEDIMAAEAQAESARAQLQSAENNLNAARLTAPNDGVIGLVSAVVGQRTSGVGNSSSSEDGFITLISDRLRVRAQVNEADIGRAAVGQKAFFTVNSYPGRRFEGVVESISPKAVTVSNVQLYDVIISLDRQEDALKVGMPANVSIIVDQKAGVTLLPKIAASYAAQEAQKFSGQQVRSGSQGGSGTGEQNNAGRGGAQGGSGGEEQGGVRRQGSGGGSAAGDGRKKVPVLVMESGKPVLRMVQVGISDNTSYEVVDGLKEGDKVVIGNTAQSASGTTGRQGAGSQPLPVGGGIRVINR
ncbi:MAG: efflux RND transporter periplasmic adaptor subunit [Peptococcaceae bacterium]|nr:efflux RND transporter periplasmic adaptor subunit [Peptococcaceae bacterium]